MKAVKAIEWIAIIRSDQAGGGGGANCLNLVFVDIGANIGHVCIPLLLYGICSRVIAIEPDPDNYKLLRCNAILNDIESKIDFHNIAVGRYSSETLDLELSNDNFGDHRIRVSDAPGLYKENSRQVRKVESKSLDSLFGAKLTSEELMLWIDVQGYEGEVLAGASLLLANKPPVVIEFWPYGLKRSQGFESLIKAISVYDYFYDLLLDRPIAAPVNHLVDLYNSNIQNDHFTMDLLFVHADF